MKQRYIFNFKSTISNSFSTFTSLVTRKYYYHYFYSYHESGFLSHIYIKVNRLFTPVKNFKCKRGLSKQSGLSCSKSSKETQEETVKQAQSQQYRHQSKILDITLLPPPSTLYPIHTPLQSPHFNSKQKNADIAVIFLALEFKQNLRNPTVKRISHSQTKFTHPNFDTKSLHSLQSHPSGSHFLILFLKSSRLFKFFISIGTICQTLEAKNLIEFRPYLLLFAKFLKKSV